MATKKAAAAKTPKTVDAYIAGYPKDVQAKLKQVRQAIRDVAPEAEERIAYQMAAYKLHGRVLVYFAGHTHHTGMYPVPVGVFDKEFAKYETSGKGTVRFPYDRPVPVALIKKVVRHLAREVEAKAKARRA